MAQQQFVDLEGEVPIDDPLEDEETVKPIRYGITSYGADFTVDGIVRRMSDGSIFVPPFQRRYVWKSPQASRFVESLLLGLPVPGVFLSQDPATRKQMVIDGQQRLRTLQYFYDGIFGPSDRNFRLTGVQPELTGLTYSTLPDPDRRALDDAIIHATIVKQDDPPNDQSSVYQIFERLNTGGLQLQPQEIRTCVYYGRFVQSLADLNDDSAWRQIYGPQSSRMRDQELILRFLAFFFDAESYSRPMREFLNQFMFKNRSLSEATGMGMSQAFRPTIKLVFESIGPAAFKPQRALNAAVFDSVMIGVARRLAIGSVLDRDAVRARYEALLADTTYSDTIARSTADEERVRDRMRLAEDAFRDIE
jgi:hypothetical protein